MGFPRASLLRMRPAVVELVALCSSPQVCINLWGCLITQVLAQSDLSPPDPSNQRADEALMGGPKQCQLIVLEEYWSCFSDHCSLTTKRFSSSFYCGICKSVLDPSARKSGNSAGRASLQCLGSRRHATTHTLCIKSSPTRGLLLAAGYLIQESICC